MLLAVIHKACRAERLILAPTLSFSLPLSAFLPLSPQHHSRSFNAARAAPSKCLPAKKLSKLHHHGLPLIRPQPATQERRLQARSASQLANQKKKKNRKCCYCDSPSFSLCSRSLYPPSSKQQRREPAMSDAVYRLFCFNPWWVIHAARAAQVSI